MIACVGVDYRGSGAVAGCVFFRGWPDAEGVSEAVIPAEAVEPYEAGQLYRRERLLAVLEAAGVAPDVVVRGRG